MFIDDAVWGDLPKVCVRSGIPTSDLVIMTRPVGGMGAGAWLLLLLGPFGWLALAILGSLGTGREQLTIQLPYSLEVRSADRPVRDFRRLAGVVAAIALAAIFVRPGPVWGIILITSVILVAVASFVLNWRGVDVDLDASRRWVTLGNVHPEFVRAVEASAEHTGRRE